VRAEDSLDEKDIWSVNRAAKAEAGVDPTAAGQRCVYTFWMDALVRDGRSYILLKRSGNKPLRCDHCENALMPGPQFALPLRKLGKLSPTK
jgi:hypothetical protein